MLKKSFVIMVLSIFQAFSMCDIFPVEQNYSNFKNKNYSVISDFEENLSLEKNPELMKKITECYDWIMGTQGHRLIGTIKIPIKKVFSLKEYIEFSNRQFLGKNKSRFNITTIKK